MRINTISYERLHTCGHFENEKFRAEAILEAGENVDDAADRLRAFVNDQIAASDAQRTEIRGDQNG